jgi:thiosulfate dehydrogenase [quinone] large subunit
MTAKSKTISNLDPWHITGLTILSIRFVQGFIFWGGGSRRFIYAPVKLDPYASSWMANKLQSAMPGALLDVNVIISFLLNHFYLLYTSIILFSLIELISGAALILGCFTRFAGFTSACLSIMLMIIFGWEGSTCIDEWTIAVSSLAMGLTLALAGGSVYSVDAYMMKRHPKLTNKRWFHILATGALPEKLFKYCSWVFILLTMFFTLATYNHYRGSIYSKYHNGPVSPRIFHLTISNLKILPSGGVTFSAYLDAGTTSVPSHIMRMVLATKNGKVVEAWDRVQMTPEFITIHNRYDYNRITLGPYGLVAPIGAKAVISLRPVGSVAIQKGTYMLDVYSIDGEVWRSETTL